MNTDKKNATLYNVLFPFWMLLMLSVTWGIVLPGNFIIDSAVLLVSLKILKVMDKKQWYKKYILKIYLFGMLSDVIGAAYMFLMMTGFEIGQMGDELYLTVPALVLSAFFIFIFNYFVTFRKAEGGLGFKLAMIFAVVTAPYTFLIPSSWLY